MRTKFLEGQNFVCSWFIAIYETGKLIMMVDELNMYTEPTFLFIQLQLGVVISAFFTLKERIYSERKVISKSNKWWFHSHYPISSN